MTTIILYPLLTAAMFYLGARATITQWLWSRYPRALDRFLNCAACAGTWYGAAVALVVGYPLGLPFLELDGRAWYTPCLVAACALMWTPLLAVLHQQALMSLGMPADPEPVETSLMPPAPVQLSPEDASEALSSLRPR